MHPRTAAKLQRALLTTVATFAGIIVLRKLGWAGKLYTSDSASWAEIYRNADSYFVLALALGGVVFFCTGNGPE